ncbi:hypothetical protein K443DRAFT_126615 [Laccaria amethystina LaAM-08-1]|uniref:JmjC domain-containing protein n=1 Tax=Laccaria amethystina LaAM-08-1 TaxID=1095629 RepID=A0A0C9WX82_9AGAR|nr:hypothetical protein K443DRAFT_126615 [Laccaria amethystina LaAM-08-1]
MIEFLKKNSSDEDLDIPEMSEITNIVKNLHRLNLPGYIMLWEAIFSIARGEGAKSALEKFLARIPWDNLDSIEDSERHWFHAKEKQEMKHMADIDDIDIEGDIPKNWPLTIIEQPPHSPSLNSSLLEIDSASLTRPDTSLLDMNLAACDRTPDGGIASDLAAWTLTENTAWCNGFCSLFPTRDVRWGLAANAGAIHWFHIDSDGFGTYVDVVSKNGKKLWLVARPVDNPAAFFRTNLFSLEDYTMEGPNEHKFIIEAILLAPGMRLYMPPNTPHFVITISDAICVGGHFYSSSGIRDTNVALFQAFTSGGHITNTAHAASRVLLRRLAFLWHSNIVLGQNKDSDRAASHVPDFTTWGDVLDLLVFCSLMELLNVVDHETYDVSWSTSVDDANLPAHPGMSPQNRLECIAARKKSREMLQFFFSHYELLDQHDQAADGFGDIWICYFVRQVAGLLALKKMAVAESVEGAKDCTEVKFQRQLQYVIDGQPRKFLAIYHEPHAGDVATFAWPDSETYRVRPLADPKSKIMFDLTGMTNEDRSYFRELKQGLDTEKNSLKGGKLSPRKLKKRKRLSSLSH